MGSAVAQPKTLKEQIVGTWIAVSNVNIAKDGKMRRDNQDESPATIRMRMRRMWPAGGRA
jgi:hypothetical protein